VPRADDDVAERTATNLSANEEPDGQRRPPRVVAATVGIGDARHGVHAAALRIDLSFGARDSALPDVLSRMLYRHQPVSFLFAWQELGLDERVEPGAGVRLARGVGAAARCWLPRLARW
jgi:hypothetical protein